VNGIAVGLQGFEDYFTHRHCDGCSDVHQLGPCWG
jgi:hypothetical protein